MIHCSRFTSEPEDTTHVPLIVGLVGGVFLVTLLIGIGLVAVGIRLRREKTSMFVCYNKLCIIVDGYNLERIGRGCH